MQNSTIAKIALSAVVIVGVTAFLARSTASSTEHYFMVDQLMARGDLGQWKDKKMKVHGWVVAGSIKEKIVNQETVRTFVLQKEGKNIVVFSKGPKPDTFKDQSEVVASGLIVPAGEMVALAKALDTPLASDMPYVVDAAELMAKCPSKYNGADPNKNLEDPKFK
jgi:cytochrome c-type biogenesis protein CcmE